MPARLIAEEGALVGKSLDLSESEELILGRDPEECQLVIEDPTVSRKHLVCRQTDDGFVIENLSDTNPILVNENPLEKPVVLQHGDVIKIGQGTYRFYEETEAQVDENGEPNSTPIDDHKKNDEPEEADETFSSLDEDAKEPPPPSRDSIFEEDDFDDDDELEAAPLAEVDFDMTDSSPWLLKVVDGPNNGAEFSMDPEASYVLGSDPSACDIVFHDVSVSRQHARLRIGADGAVSIEDLNSSNGTVVDGDKVEGKQEVEQNTIVSLGTSSFIVFNQEGERSTIISPLLPSIVKVLQEKEKERELHSQSQELSQPMQSDALPPVEEKKDKTNNLSTLVLISLITGLFVVISLGTALLFQTETVSKPQIDAEAQLTAVLEQYPAVNYSYNSTTGRLLLVGHVLTSVDRNQLRYDLGAFPFISTMDDNIVVDEFIWQEINQVLSKNPNWKGVALHSPAPGAFVLTGSLKSQQQMEQLNDYLNQNFPYIDLLEKRVIVEEEIISQINSTLRSSGMTNIAVRVDAGEVTLSGTMADERRPLLSALINEIEAIPGVRRVKNFVTEVPTTQAVVNITESYPVTGSSTQGGQINVIIKGRILREGDSIDGLLIKEIRPGMIFLEKDGVKYRIDYNP